MARPAHARTFLATLVCALVVLSGCGELSKSEYITEMQAITKQMDREGGVLTTASSSPTPQEVQRQQRAFAAAADRIEDLDPPAAIAAPHAKYVKALRAFASDLGTLAQAIDDADGDPERLAEGISSLQGDMEEDVARLGDVADMYREAGYATAIATGSS